MGKYNFDNETNRRHTDSLKWGVAENELPMWVADMDFKTAPEIIEALKEKADEGTYGYTIVPKRWYDAYTRWWSRRHAFDISPEWLMFCTGVVPAISSIVRKMTTIGENILVQTPVYNIFFNSILNNGRFVIENPLIRNDKEYCIDYDDLEEKLSDPQTGMMILCNPHNPVGRIWNREELKRIGEICCKHGVIVVSDEIHCDITLPNHSYVPFASVSDKCREISITCIAPTKAFNIAGLQTSAILVPNERLRNKVNRAINTDEVAEPNYFAVEAAVAAFTKGEEWLDELRLYLSENKKIVKEYLTSEIVQLSTNISEATYLMWIDCGKITDNAYELAGYIRKKTGLYISAGGQYGGEGIKFLRLNIACQRYVLMDGLKRLKMGIELWLSKEGKTNNDT